MLATPGVSGDGIRTSNPWGSKTPVGTEADATARYVRHLDSGVLLAAEQDASLECQLHQDFFLRFTGSLRAAWSSPCADAVGVDLSAASDSDGTS